MITQIVATTTDQVVFQAIMTGLLATASWIAYRAAPPRRARRLAWILVLVAATEFGFIAFTYIRWAMQLRGDQLGQYLLPPHSTYYLRHLQTEMTSLVVSWLAVLLTWWGARWLFIKKLQGQMIDHLDVMLLVIGTAVIGWPGLFLYWLNAFLLAIVSMIVLVILRRKKMTDRLVVTFALLPAAWVTLLLRSWLLDITRLVKIGF